MQKILIENIAPAYPGQLISGAGATSDHTDTADAAHSKEPTRYRIAIEDGLIKHIERQRNAQAQTMEVADSVLRIDANGLLPSAGFIDVYARLREPGMEKKATIASEAKAAALGGITTLFCSPDTDPVIDEAATVELINRKARDAAFSRVLPLAATTRGLDGEHLSELATLTSAGCVAATNADKPIANLQVVRRLMDYARTFDTVLIFTPADPGLSANGCAHEGATASRLGIPAIPVAAETVALAMLIELAWQSGAKIHISRLSSKRGVEMIASAKKDGLDITADTTINHLFLEESCLADFDSQYRSVVPFRSTQDRESLREAVADGTIDVICSDHAPHDRDAKLAPFPSAAPGLSSLDTLLPLLLKLHHETGISLPRLLESVTAAPASIFKLQQGTLQAGRPADVILIDTEKEVTLEPATMHSKGKNSPFLGQTFRGQVKTCIARGRVLKND